MELENKNSNFTTQRYFSNYFGFDYSELNSTKQLSGLLFIQNFDKKITYLLQAFPYPDLVKIILKKLKFSYFREKITLETLQDIIEKDFEEHELKCLVSNLNEFTSTSLHLDFFEGYFYGDHSQVYYRMRNDRKIEPRITINFRRFNPTNS